jgi:hypothetical protein
VIPQFKVKPDKNDYPALKDPGYFVRWARLMVTVATSHGCANVLAHDYYPTSYGEWQNFYTQQAFMYAVLVDKVKYPEGIRIVRNHHRTSDAQKAYHELTRHSRTSTYARITLQKLSQQINTMVLDSRWHKPYVEFITLYTNLVEEHNEMQTNPQATITPEMSMIRLQEAVKSIPVLNNVRVMDLQHVTAGTKAPNDYWQYTNCLLSAATIADEDRIKKPTRGANQHEFDYDSLLDQSDDHEPATETEWQAYKTQRVPSNGVGRLDDSIWSQMSLDERKAWTALPLATRANILGKSAETPRSTRSVNNTEQERGPSPHEDTADHPPDTLEVHKTETKPDNVTNGAHPADIRRVLAKKNNKATKVNTVRIIHHAQTADLMVSAHHPDVPPHLEHQPPPDIPEDDDSIPPLLSRTDVPSSSDDDSSDDDTPPLHVPPLARQGDTTHPRSQARLRPREESSGGENLGEAGPDTEVTRSMYHIETVEDSHSMYQIDTAEDSSVDTDQEYSADDEYGFSDEEPDF